MQTSIHLKWLSVLFIIMLLWSTTFTVTEGQAALKLWLGKLEQDPKTHHAQIIGPGLHAKVPMLHQIRFFDMRLRTLDVQSSRIVTSEKKDVLVDYYVKWQIDDLGTYFIRTSGEAKRAEMLLSQQLNDALRAEFGRRTIADVVAEDRTDIMSRLSEVANKNAQPLGIKIVDVRIKRIDLPDEVSNAVFETMKAERKRVADEHRARGQSSAEAIRADADATVTVLLAKAQNEAEQIRGNGDAQAARIYAQAFQKDPDFYSFNQSLITYAKALANQKTVFVMKPDGQFFQYLKKSK